MFWTKDWDRSKERRKSWIECRGLGRGRREDRRMIARKEGKGGILGMEVGDSVKTGRIVKGRRMKRKVSEGV